MLRVDRKINSTREWNMYATKKRKGKERDLKEKEVEGLRTERN